MGSNTLRKLAVILGIIKGFISLILISRFTKK